MGYKDEIRQLSETIPENIVDLRIERKIGSIPTQAFSDFLTHSEQGDWAEFLFFNSILESGTPYIPVRYGRSDKIIAGDPGFKEFYNKYQNELDEIGKRPDILLFKPEDYKQEWGEDISKFSLDTLKDIVPLTIAGFEVRSSSYLTEKFKPKEDKPFLSFTPKVEDLLVVSKWIEVFGVPHFYVQVFFDKIYIISFKDILSLLREAETEERGKKNKKIIGKKHEMPVFIIEKNPKNQYKETIHIYINNGKTLGKISEVPQLIGNRKELAGGRLLHYVSFEGGKAVLDKKVLLEIIENTI